MASVHNSSLTRVAAFNPHYERLLGVIRCGNDKDAISLFSSEHYSVHLEIEYVFEDRMMYKITPLNWAVRFNKAALCKYLLEHGARPFSNLVYEYYPLHEACCRGFDAIVAIFIEKRCDLNKTTPIDQDTPLHIACVRGNVGCVHLLLGANVNPNLRNAAGHTPLEAAVYNNQDDLVKLFAAYGISNSPVTTTSAPVTHPLNLVTHPSHSPLQRRHSLSSPTSSLQRIISTVRPSSRPTSVLFSDFEPNVEVRPPSRVNTIGTTSSPSKSSSLTNGDSYSSYIRTTAPSISPLAVTQVDSGCSDSLRPTYISQLSIASPSSANSPSPVERDCGLHKSWMSGDSRNQNPTNAQSGYYYSMPSKLTTSDTTHVVSSTKHRVPTTYNVKNGGQYNSTLNASKTFPGVEIPAAVKICQTTHGYSDHRRPELKQMGIHRPLKDSCGIVTPSVYNHTTSSPESLSCKDKTKCAAEKRLKTLTIPKAAAPVETLTPSPSRERINSLVHCVTNALERVHSENGEELSSTITQKLSAEVAETVNLTHKHLNSLVQLALSTPTDTKSNHSPDRDSDVPYVTTAAADHPAEALREIGLNIEDHPRDVRLGEPTDGYMSVLFNLRSSHETNEMHGTSKKSSNQVVKVVVRVFNLRDPMESNLYHSLDPEQLLDTDLRTDHISEIDILQQLSDSPHPCIAQLMNHFKAGVSNQYDRFARQACPDNADKVYVTRKVADFIVLSMPCKTLGQYFEDVKPTSICAISESKILSILSQLLLATAHLNRHKIAHNSIHPDNIFVDCEDHDTVIISNFGNAISLDNISTDKIIRLQQTLSTDVGHGGPHHHVVDIGHGGPHHHVVDIGHGGPHHHVVDVGHGGPHHHVVAPEVTEALLTDYESSLLIDDMPALFETSDSYAVAQMVYELVLGPSHKFVRELGRSCYSYNQIPVVNGLSPLLNHLLKNLLAYDAATRLTALPGAVGCLVLLFGPNPSQINSLKECKEWLLAETIEFFLRPSLKDISNSDSHAKLLCMYLTLANANPSLVFNACLFFQDQMN